METMKYGAEPSAAVAMEKREGIKVQRAQGSRNRMAETSSLVLWFDSRALPPGPDGDALVQRLASLRYTGIVLYPDNLEHYGPIVPARLHRIVHVGTADDLGSCS